MKIQYNAPLTLSFTLVSTLMLLIDSVTPGDLSLTLFAVDPHMSWTNPLSFLRLVSHVIGHADLNHLFGNFTLILLLGPILEEKYGSSQVFMMCFITAFMTGVLQVAFSDHALMGASGIVFMMILLSSFGNYQAGKIPLTFILVVLLFLGKEFLDVAKQDNVSQFAHIVGGICGGVFGFMMGRQGRRYHTPPRY